MARVCRWCQRELVGTSEVSRNWYCPSCKRFDASECFKCRTQEGFPLAEPWLTPEAARTSPLPLDAFLKQWVYCRLCLHNAYFVVPAGDLMSRCRLCGTEWERVGPAVHTEVIALDGPKGGDARWRCQTL